MISDYRRTLNFFRQLKSQYPDLFRTSSEGYPSPLDWHGLLPDIAELKQLRWFVQELHAHVNEPDFKKLLSFKSRKYSSLHPSELDEFRWLRASFGSSFGYRETAFADLVEIPEFEALRTVVVANVSLLEEFTSSHNPTLHEAVRYISRAKLRRLIIQNWRREMHNRLRLWYWTIANECHSLALVLFNPLKRQTYQRNIAASKLAEMRSNLPEYARELSALGEEREGKYDFQSNAFVQSILQKWPMVHRLCSPLF
ncbi:MAG: hypothetical protein WA231_21700 [Methylocella sp.]